MSDERQPINRREALRTGLRLGGLGGLVVLAAGLRVRNGACPNTSPCAGCPAYVDCSLPKAARQRAASGTEVNHG